jgi:hypothetical protein
MKPHKSVIRFCATLCKDGSKYKNNKDVKIIYTEIKNVKKADKVGAVNIKKIQNIKV